MSDEERAKGNKSGFDRLVEGTAKLEPHPVRGVVVQEIENQRDWDRKAVEAKRAA